MGGSLLAQFTVATALVFICVAVHGLGLFSLSRALRSEVAIERLRKVKALSFRGALFTLSIVLAIIALHGIEIWIFALTYLATGAIGTLEEALYFSTISYSTVGFSDSHIGHEWRLLGAFESILGMILIGWSTAFFFLILRRIDAH